MFWQDLVISGAGIVFTLALLPQVWQGFAKKEGVVNPWTSGPTFIALYAMTAAYLTLGLVLSTAVLSVSATLWLLLFVQWLLYRTKA